MNKKIEEVWKGVIYQGCDYSDKLEISNIGELRNVNTKHIYKTYINKRGYKQVSVSFGSKNNKKTFRIHRCVAESFISNPNNLPIINHKDGNKLNNIVENLEWCTYSGNTQHAFAIGIKSNENISGIKNLYSKFSEEDIRYIKKNYIPRDKKFGIRALAKKYNVHHSTIENVIHNKSYKNVA